MKSSLSLMLLLTATGCNIALGESITSVSPLSTAQIQTITISGNGFGTQAPYTGDSSHIDFIDVTKHWGAGYVGPCPAPPFPQELCGGNTFFDHAVTLTVDSWTDSQIELGGFSGAWGAPNPDLPGTTWTLSTGDEIQIYLWNAQTGAFAGSITTTVGAAPAVPEPSSFALVFGAFGLLSMWRFRGKHKRAVARPESVRGQR
jgi:hypothetical protein